MREARESLTVCATSACNAIYAVGGVTSQGKVTHRVEKYSVQSGSWEMVAPLKTLNAGFNNSKLVACITQIQDEDCQ